MIGRRGFLGMLAAAVTGAALDPERLLWAPGKLISIPKRVHIPQTRIFSVHQLLPDFMNRVRLDFPTLERTYLSPAALSLDLAVQRAIRESGGAPARFLPMELPSGVGPGARGPFGVIPEATWFYGYNPINDQDYLISRCMVRI